LVVVWVGKGVYKCGSNLYRDLSIYLHELCRELFPNADNIKIVLGGAKNLSFEENSFDL